MAVKSARVNQSQMFSSAKYIKAMNKRLPFLFNSSADIVVNDIERGIDYGRDIDGKPMKPLKPATIRAKRKSGSKTPRIALSDKGIMKKTYIKKKATPTNLETTITIPKKRIEPEIGRFHHEGMGNNPVRKWFGISNTASMLIKKAVKIIMTKELRNHWGM